MIFDIMDQCPHCKKRNVKFLLMSADHNSELNPEKRYRTQAQGGQNVYSSVWVCQNCRLSLGAAIFVAL